MPRKARSDTASHTQTNMAEAGLIGSGIIRDYLRGKDTKNRKVKPISMVKLTAALKSVEHAIGLPKAKIILKTDALTMQDIAELAETFDKNTDKTGGNSNIKYIPTKPLTARQVRERANN